MKLALWLKIKSVKISVNIIDLLILDSLPPFSCLFFILISLWVPGYIELDFWSYSFHGNDLHSDFFACINRTLLVVCPYRKTYSSSNTDSSDTTYSIFHPNSEVIIYKEGSEEGCIQPSQYENWIQNILSSQNRKTLNDQTNGFQVIFDLRVCPLRAKKRTLAIDFAYGKMYLFLNINSNDITHFIYFTQIQWSPGDRLLIKVVIFF